MEVESLGKSIKRTPEQGLRKAVSVFLEELGLTVAWQPIQSLSAVDMRTAWKKACKVVGRQPDRPYLANDRAVPHWAEE